jgi:hypothetical protein
LFTSKEDNMKKEEISAQSLTGAMAAEEHLANEERQEFLHDMPDGPMKDEFERQKGLLGGDLAGLPPGHPLLQAMEEARLRYEAEQEMELQPESEPEENVQIKQAKRLDEKKARTEQRVRQEERRERHRTAAKIVNHSIVEVYDALKRLDENIKASHEDMQGDNYSMMKLERLSRVVAASMRGMSESKLNLGRMTDE